MKNYQFLNKRISTPAGIIIIFLVALFTVGILDWQYFGAPKIPTPIPIPATAPIPAPDETAGWKTYIDEKNGYEYKYPTNLLDILDGYPEIIITDAGNENLTKICPSDPDIIVDNDYDINGEKMAINNISYCKYVDIGGGGAGTEAATYKYTFKNKRLYTLIFYTRFAGHYDCSWGYEDELSISKCKDSHRKIPEMIEKILSTFKFI